MTKPTGVNPEFVAEAQEIVDALNRDLIAAESEAKAGEVPPDRINNLFRSAHSLKGISGMFGLDAISSLAHALESVLDGMRLGRVRIDPNALDVLYGCIERFGSLIKAASEGQEPDTEDLEKFIAKVTAIATGKGAKEATPLDFVHIGEEILSVLTEYEEHRLNENVRRGRNLYMLRTSFDLSSFDMGLAVLDEAVKNVGEVITKLPSSKEAEPGTISFDIVVGADCSTDELIKVIGDDRVEVVPVHRRAIVAPEAAIIDEATEALLGSDEPLEDIVASAGKDTSSDENASVKSVSQTVRVDIRRLDRLMNLVGELALTKVAFQRISETMKRDQGFTGLAVDLHKESRNFERRLSELQAGIMEVRMVPLANLFERMVRIGRKMGRELERQVHIEVSGEHTELDKLIVEDLADPLMHLIRNAIDHGIEQPHERVAAGKKPEGVVRLSAAAQGNHVVVQVNDDGRGIDVKQILDKAVAKGLVSKERAPEMSRRDVFNLLFLPGFSTREQVSEYSGRGVGMDVVKTNIAELSGVIDIDSELGEGTSITVTLPITLAIIPALIVSVAKHTYAIPLNNVTETLAVTKSMVSTIERREVISVRGSTVPLLDLRRLFSLEEQERPDLVYGVVAGVNQSRMALLVDNLVGQQDIVIKSLGRRLRNVRGIAGATELGNQETILVIDMVELLNEAAGSPESIRESA